MNYYNEIDPCAAAWLRELIARKHIPDGHVDERSITDVKANELLRYTQRHFFAGIGGWSLALRIAGVPDNARIDTGSCPCPPFSSAGKKKICPQCGGKPVPHPLKTGIFACVPCGHEWFADERHLYPELFRLIKELRSPIFFGEQVVGTDGLVWLAGVRATLEAVGYGFGAADLCSAGVASPNLRQRLMFVAVCDRQEWDGSERNKNEEGDGGPANRGRLGYPYDSRSQRHGGDGRDRHQPGRINPESTGSTGPSSGAFERMGDPEGGGCGIIRDAAQPRDCGHADGAGIPIRLAHTDGRDAGTERQQSGGEQRLQSHSGGSGFWADSIPILCRDGKYRRVPTEPALFPLADGLPYRLARRGSVRPALLKGAGNAINAHVAARFIRAYFDVVA